VNVMRLEDLAEALGFGPNAVALKGSTYEEYIRLMEQMRLNWGRVQRDGRFYDPRIGRYRWGPIQHPGPMPIDLKAYVVARQYDGDKYTFPKVIPELVKHKEQLHPFARRYLLERLRHSERKYRTLANRFGAVADQFEIKEQPQPASRDVATKPPDAA
jgi:hypothetical protein